MNNDLLDRMKLWLLRQIWKVSPALALRLGYVRLVMNGEETFDAGKVDIRYD